MPCSGTAPPGGVVALCLHIVGVVRQIVPQSVGQWQILDLPRCLVDGDATQVLQRWRSGVHRFGEQQLHRAVGRRRR